jgi:Protein of unknown function (DUF2975)
MRSTRQRWTWLGPIRVLLVILLVLDCLSLPIGVLQLFNGGYPIGTVMFGDLFPQGIPNFTHSDMSFGAVDVMWHPTGFFQILMFGLSHGLGSIVATLPMLGYAYHVTGDALRNDPFTLAMVRKLRTLGLLILVGGVVSEAAAFVAARALLDDALSNEPTLREGASLDPSQYPSFWWLLPGLLVLAFAEVVRRGCYLRAELDEVI